ncbi:hypothetical protein MTBSS4_70066 [Magnetospirillum sp. SS-4]|nr:hypothetical protein MTBSS4_70066 [Magnetospirillum sp. SS-4]
MIMLYIDAKCGFPRNDDRLIMDVAPAIDCEIIMPILWTTC